MNKLFLVLITPLIFFVFAKSTQAKVLPQSAKALTKQTTVKSAGGSTITVYPRLRSDRRALIVSFANLQNATQVSYLLLYQQNSQEEGAKGAIKLSGASSTSQELLFGTCSKNVCRYHTGVQDARLEVSYTSKTGKKYLKKFKIKV